MAPYVDINEPDIQLSSGQDSAEQLVLKVNDYSVSYDELLLENVRFEIAATDKVAVIGANGTIGAETAGEPDGP